MPGLVKWTLRHVGRYAGLLYLALVLGGSALVVARVITMR